MRNVTPANYEACPGSGQPARTIANPALRVAFCHECGRKTGVRGKMTILTRHESKASWDAKHPERVS